MAKLAGMGHRAERLSWHARYSHAEAADIVSDMVYARPAIARIKGQSTSSGLLCGDLFLCEEATRACGPY